MTRMNRSRFRELVHEELHPFKGKLTFSFAISPEGPWTLYTAHAYSKRTAQAMVSAADNDATARQRIRRAITYTLTGATTA